VEPVSVPPDFDEPYAVVVPYWNVTVVDKLFGLTVPLSVAPVFAIFVAVPVVALGGVATLNEKLTEQAPVTAPVVYVVVLHEPVAHVPPTVVFVL
jgi:hypothetical protein